MATLATYTTLVQNEVDDTSNRAKNIIERALKDTYQEVLNFTLEYLVGTEEEDVVATIDQRYISPTKTWQDVKFVLYKGATEDHYDRLNRITEKEYYDKHINRESNSPTSYYLKGNDIYFNTAPSDAGTVKISGVEVQEELEGTQVSVIPDRFTDTMVLGAVARFKAYEGLPDAREYYKLYRGPYYEQGKVGGALKYMIDQVNTKEKPARVALYPNVKKY
jgi:hypothetical protein